jgi:hypothetical protein
MRVILGGKFREARHQKQRLCLHAVRQFRTPTIGSITLPPQNALMKA